MDCDRTSSPLHGGHQPLAGESGADRWSESQRKTSKCSLEESSVPPEQEISHASIPTPPSIDQWIAGVETDSIKERHLFSEPSRSNPVWCRDDRINAGPNRADSDGLSDPINEDPSNLASSPRSSTAPEESSSMSEPTRSSRRSSITSSSKKEPTLDAKKLEDVGLLKMDIMAVRALEEGTKALMKTVDEDILGPPLRISAAEIEGLMKQFVAVTPAVEDDNEAGIKQNLLPLLIGKVPYNEAGGQGDSEGAHLIHHFDRDFENGFVPSLDNAMAHTNPTLTRYHPSNPRPDVVFGLKRSKVEGEDALPRKPTPEIGRAKNLVPGMLYPFFFIEVKSEEGDRKKGHQQIAQGGSAMEFALRHLHEQIETSQRTAHTATSSTTAEDVQGTGRIEQQAQRTGNNTTEAIPQDAKLNSHVFSALLTPTRIDFFLHWSQEVQQSSMGMSQKLSYRTPIRRITWGPENFTSAMEAVRIVENIKHWGSIGGHWKRVNELNRKLMMGQRSALPPASQA